MRGFSIDVLGQRIRVHVVDQMPEGFESNVGLYFQPAALILILKGDKKLMMETLAHEIGHAALDQAGVHNTKLSDDLEEIIVDCIGRCIVANLPQFKKLK